MFEIYRDKKNKWRFRAKAKNGKIVAQGEGYSSKQGCKKGIFSLCTIAGSNDGSPTIIEV